MGVLEFKEPSADRSVWAVFLAVGGDYAFLGEEPVRRIFGGVVILFDTGFGEGVEGEAGVPDGGKARLDANLIAVLAAPDEEIVQVLVGGDDARVIVGIAEDAED